MFYDESQALNQMRSDLNQGDEIGQKLVYDRDSKTLRDESPFDDPDSTIRVTPEDMGVF